MSWSEAKKLSDVAKSNFVASDIVAASCQGAGNEVSIVGSGIASIVLYANLWANVSLFVDGTYKHTFRVYYGYSIVIPFNSSIVARIDDISMNAVADVHITAALYARAFI